MRVLAITPELPSSDRPGTMAPGARQLQSLRKVGVDVVSHDMRGIPLVKYLQALPRVRSIAKDVDLIHAHFGYCGLLARLQLRKPIVVSFMGSDLLGSPVNSDGRLSTLSKVMVQVHRLLAPRVDQVIVKSRQMAQIIQPTPCHVIPNGVDTELFRPGNRDAARRELGWSTEKPYVLFPGNPDDPRKGFKLATAALDVTKKQLGCDVETVSLRGVPPDTVAKYMAACDAMWMTSLLEGSPNVVKEAMACDWPVVGVEVGDVAELLTGVQGSFICERDAAHLGSRMAEAINAKVAPGGRKGLFDRSLDDTSIAERIVVVYRLALGDVHGARSTDPTSHPAVGA